VFEENIFFMLPNGKKQILPITSTFPKKVFPIVGMHSPNEKVAVNLGELPFVHDIEPVSDADCSIERVR
jgi:flagellar assembly factor FliW